MQQQPSQLTSTTRVAEAEEQKHVNRKQNLWPYVPFAGQPHMFRTHAFKADSLLHPARQKKIPSKPKVYVFDTTSETQSPSCNNNLPLSGKVM